MKKLSLLLVALVLITVITGCQNSNVNNDGDNSGKTGETIPEGGKLFNEPVTFSLMIPEHATYPYTEGLFLETAIAEKYNVNFDVTPVQDGFNDRLSLDIASDQMKDLIFMMEYDQVMKAGMQGALIDFNKYIDKMPNFKAWAEENKEYVSYYKSGNGELFFVPNQGYGADNETFWLYRRDLFEEHNLTTPKTSEEFYNVLKILKDKYPDSYPFANRDFIFNLSRIGTQWSTGYPMYYNNDQSKWVYGPIEDNFKEMLIFFNKLYEEDLMPPNSLTLDTKGWQDLISTNNSFITNDYSSRIDSFNQPMREENPNFYLDFMPPFKGGENGKALHDINNTLLIVGMSISSKSKNVEEAVKFLDTMYTKEAIELTSWGEEGKTYEVVNDEKHYIDAINDVEVKTKYGIFQRGFYLVIDPAAMLSYYSIERTEATQAAQEYNAPYRAPHVPFTTEAEEQKNILQVNIDTHAQENISQFILGERPFSEWNDYVEELKDLGIDDLVNIYNESYDSFLGNAE